MNVSGIGRSMELTQLRGVTTTSAKTAESGAAGSGDASSVTVSKPAEMLQKLAALQESDPAKFKEVVSQIAEKLEAAAESEGGGASAMLSDLASRFAQAAETGDLSILEPPRHEPPAGGQGEGGRAREAYAKNGPPPPPNDSVKQALDDAFSLIDAAASSANSTSSATSLTSSL